jgi:outer membrane protein assembly factor BamB
MLLLMIGTKLHIALLLALGLLLIAACDVNGNRAPEGVAVYGPRYADVNSTHMYSFGAYDPDGDSVRFRLRWDYDDTSDWTDPVASGILYCMPHSWETSGYYTVTAQARDIHGAESDWALNLDVLVGISPDTPARPIGPEVVQVGRLYWFKTVSRNKDTLISNLKYVFDWGRGKLDTTPGYFPDDDTAGCCEAWYTPGEYDILVRALSWPLSIPSAWSAPHRILVDSIGWLKWQRQLGAATTSSPALDADYGRLYVGCDDYRLYALGLDGEIQWTFAAGAKITATPAVAVDGSIIFGSHDDTLYAVNPDGTLCWKRGLEGKALCAAAVGPHNAVYVGDDGGFLHVRAPGADTWLTFEAEDDIRSAPSIGADGTIYFGSDDDNIYAVTPACSLLWLYPTGSNVRTSPAIDADGNVYVGSEDNNLYALGPDGSLRWKYEADGRIRSSPAIAADGTIYFGTETHGFYALNPDGTLKWRYDAEGDVASSPAIGSNRRVYFGTDGNLLYSLDHDGVLMWKYDCEADIKTAPVIGPDSAIYFTSEDGTVWALRTCCGPGYGAPWPMYRRDLLRSGRMR